MYPDEKNSKFGPTLNVTYIWIRVLSRIRNGTMFTTVVGHFQNQPTSPEKKVPLSVQSRFCRNTPYFADTDFLFFLVYCFTLIFVLFLISNNLRTHQRAIHRSDISIQLLSARSSQEWHFIQLLSATSSQEWHFIQLCQRPVHRSDISFNFCQRPVHRSDISFNFCQQEVRIISRR